MKDVGAALESIANTLFDGIAEENELNATIPKLETAIRECASVKYRNGIWEMKQCIAGAPTCTALIRKGKIENLGPIRVR